MTSPDTPVIAPSQVAHPGRTVARTTVQIAVGLAAIAPFLAQDLGLNVTGGLIAGVLGVAAAVTRIMAIPAVNQWLTGMGLGAEPRPRV